MSFVLKGDLRLEREPATGTMEDLTSTWAGWLEKKTERYGDSFCLTLQNFERRAIRDLKEKGFAVPALRAVKTSMESAVEPLLVEEPQKAGENR